MKIVLEIDDDELRRLLRPVLSGTAPQVTMPPTRLLTIRDVADHLGISRNKAYELIYRGEIESLAIGRLRRVSPAALTKFITAPAERGPEPDQPIIRPSSVSHSSQLQSSAATAPKETRPKIRPEIDLMPKPVGPEMGSGLTDADWERSFGELKENGWPEDIVDQRRSDRKEGITRTYLLSVSDAARYLGLSRSGIDKLIKAGKLRLATIRSPYRGEKPRTLIPAKDILGLR